MVLGTSCNVNLDSLDMTCEYNDSNSGGSSGQSDLYHDYFYLLSDASHHLECDPYPSYSLVWTTFHDPSMTKTILSIVPGYEAAEFAHASAYVTGTFMQAQYKSGIPLRQVAHCNGAD